MYELYDRDFTIELAHELISAIEHGSDEHRGWLREAILAFQRGDRIPSERG